MDSEFRQVIGGISQRIRWRLGLRVAAPELESATDESIARFYNARITDCGFLSDPTHYESPRVNWLLAHVRGNIALEIGCGNGGMTALLAPKFGHLIALDISAPSLEQVNALGLSNVETVQALAEKYEPPRAFDCIVMSEVLEHLRHPLQLVENCVKWLAPGGTLLITTPNGHWESNEHLHEFTLSNFTSVVAQANAEEFCVAYIRDAQERRRWLGGQLWAPSRAPTPDHFNERKMTIARRRKRE